MYITKKSYFFRYFFTKTLGEKKQDEHGTSGIFDLVFVKLIHQSGLKVVILSEFSRRS